MAIGLSDPDTNAAWAASLDYTYEIWSDPDAFLIRHYDAEDPAEDAPLRHAWILDADGQGVVKHAGAVSIGASPARVLADCRALFGGR